MAALRTSGFDAQRQGYEPGVPISRPPRLIEGTAGIRGGPQAGRCYIPARSPSARLYPASHAADTHRPTMSHSHTEESMSTDRRRTLRTAAAFRTGHRRTFGLGALTVTALALGLVLGSAVSAVGAGAATPSKTNQGRAALAPGKINHVLVIELENEGYQTTFG